MRNPIILCCFLWLCIIFIEVSGQCLEEQRSLLIQLKKELSVDYSTKSKLESWSLTTDCCSWDGVACEHQTGHVIGLDLSSSSINGGFNSSSSLFSLRYLQQLNLADNSFYPSPLPMGFQQLLSLTHLNVSDSSFVGQVPLEISFLTRLVSLDLSNNFGYPMMLESPDLKGLIRNLTDLTELYLDGIQISLTGSEWSKVLSLALPNLSVLSMSGCNLSGPIHPSLSQLKFLTHLNLARNNLISIVPDFLANFSYLISLQLCLCNLYGRFPENIFLIPTLRILEICINPQLTGSLPKFPPGTALEVIRLSNTDFSGKLPDSISNIAFLRNLQLDDCSFIGSITSSFQNLTELVYLDLSWNNFSGSIPSLASSKKITGLILSNNGFTGSIPSSYGSDLKNLETLNLRNNLLQGMIPSSLFTIPSIKLIALSGNRFSGQLQEFQNASSLFLREIDLSQNELQGPIPDSIFKIRSLNHLSLSSNHFNGTIGVGMFDDFKHLAGLDLSDNNLSFNVSGSNSKTLSYISLLRLGSCNIFEFPNFLRNQIHLSHLDLSNNRISGALPNWVWKLGNGNLVYLNLSHNLLNGFEKPGPDFSSSTLVILDLHSNVLQGSLLIPPSSIIYLDYSNNKFTSTIPSDIHNYIYYAIFISFSSNNLGGGIPLSICEASYLKVLDLSNNHFNGSIPSCLGSIGSLKVLKLRNNEFKGIMPHSFGEVCSIRTLDLNQNQIEGHLPRSLANCKSLEVLDLGNNRLIGSFPFWLETLPKLRVLVLRSNNFADSIVHSQTVDAFPMLQIIDISSNNFRGNLPLEWFQSWKAMMKPENDSQLHKIVEFNLLELGEWNYRDSVTITIKGLEMEFVKILTIYISIDLSNNQFEGKIPEIVGNLESLYALNMSQNNLTGQIPSSFGKLKELESLDLSQNQLSGQIPQQLSGLTFLSFLNLSQNDLVGEIPRGHQFETFTEDSFEGNIGLCGSLLSKTCQESLPPTGPNSINAKATEFSRIIDWDFFWSGCGFGGGVGVLIGLVLGNAIGNIIQRKKKSRTAHGNVRQW